MREDWDRRAREDHKLHIATGHAGSEEQFLESGERDLADLVLDGIHLGPEASALEIGCGVGRLLIPLARRVTHVVGVDISPVMIETSRAYLASVPNVSARLTDGTLSGVEDASLDFVYSFIVFQHIPAAGPIRTYVEEAARVLKPGAVFRFQVDGRWWWRGGDHTPDTYEGVKFTPEAARGLLAGTPLAIVDTWGADGHYHWITARKAGEGAAVSLRPREWDAPLLQSFLARLGAASPREAADGIRSGTATLRPHLLALAGRFAAADDAAFVAEAYRAVFGGAPDDAGRAFHEGILHRGFEDRPALLDTITTSRGFLDLVRPHVPDVPWFVACEILMRLGLPPRPAGFFELVDFVEAALDGRSDAEAIRFSFRTLLGHEPDEEGLSHRLSLLETRADGRRLVLRELLASRESLKPRARESAAGPRLPGESAPGEAARAVDVLEEARDLDDRAFVRLAYRRVLLREADAGGEDFYLGKIESCELSRAALLRELLWSDEARGANAAPRAPR
jgi:SAM-dependent methyltransferase